MAVTQPEHPLFMRDDGHVTGNGGGNTPVFVGVDAGGSSVVVQAVSDDEVVFSGVGGPANATSTDQETLRRHLDEALAGCPMPSRIGVCFAGLGSDGDRAFVSAYFERRFPGIPTRLAPDYVAVLLASADLADVCCVAGTGSVCCSVEEGSICLSGGLGHLLGDEGSAYRYGRALVSFALDLPHTDIPPLAAQALEEVFGTIDRSNVVGQVSAAHAPAPLLARLAPALTASADAGEPWAEKLVAEEAGAFAGVVARHVDRYCRNLTHVRVMLAGGVWTSSAVCNAFSGSLNDLVAPRMSTIRRLGPEPVAGAIALAQLPREEIAWLGD